MKIFDKRCAQIRRLLALAAPQVPELISIAETPVGHWRVSYSGERILQIELSEDLESLHFSDVQFSRPGVSNPLPSPRGSVDFIAMAAINETEILRRLQSLPLALGSKRRNHDARKQQPPSQRSAQDAFVGDQVDTGAVRNEERVTSV
jgi:hypothetical protein